MITQELAKNIIASAMQSTPQRGNFQIGPIVGGTQMVSGWVLDAVMNAANVGAHNATAADMETGNDEARQAMINLATVTLGDLGFKWDGVKWHPTHMLYEFDVEGYHMLAGVLKRAYDQAAKGKGAERHAQGEPFDEQVMADMARRFGVGALLGQAFKKSEESQRLDHQRAIAELLGAINYLAGAIIHMEKKVEDANPF